MKLKQSKMTVLISELSFALHDAMQAGQMVHSEQRALDIGRKALAEESSVVRTMMVRYHR